MNTRIARRLALCAVLLVLLAATSRAQSVGHVYRLVEGKRGRHVQTTQRATIWQQRTPRYPSLGDSLYHLERLRIERGLRFDMRVDRPGLASRHVFASDAGTIAQPALDFVDVIFNDEGVYEIREDPRQLKGLEMWLVKGMMWLELQRGGLAVRAGGTVAHVDGTEVLFIVDQDSTEGLLYLRQGRVSFPDFSDIRVLDEQAWRLQSGQRPQLLDLLPAQHEQLRKLARYNDKTVWTKSIWERTWFRLLVGAAVVGGAIALDCSQIHLVCGGNGNGSSFVTIDIIIPD